MRILVSNAYAHLNCYHNHNIIVCTQYGIVRNSSRRVCMCLR